MDGFNFLCYLGCNMGKWNHLVDDFLECLVLGNISVTCARHCTMFFFVIFFWGIDSTIYAIGNLGLFLLCQFPFRQFPLCQLPTSSIHTLSTPTLSIPISSIPTLPTSYFVNCHFVNSHLVNGNSRSGKIPYRIISNNSYTLIIRTPPFSGKMF